MIQTINVALPIPEKRLFTYTLAYENAITEMLGCRVLVPLGQRVITGYIVEPHIPNSQSIERYISEHRIKPIIELLDEHPIFDANMLSFTKWIADYYFCSWGEVLKASLPQGMSPKSILKVSLNSDIDYSEREKLKSRAPKQSELLDLLSLSNEVSVNYLEQQLKTNSVSAQIESLIDKGFITVSRIIEKSSKPKIQKAVYIPEDILSDDLKIKAVFDELDKKSIKQSALLSRVYLVQKETGAHYILADLLKETKQSQSSVNSLVKKGILCYSETEVRRLSKDANQGSLSDKNELSLELTDEQVLCRNRINDAIESDKFKPFLLHGVTGSGKTLVYLAAIKKAIDSGKTALMLVPEISLTPQLIDRFTNAFPDGVVVLHSRMSEGERYDTWRMVQKNQAKIVIGARSAVFAPLKNLGLIIIDEEHESSYKQSSPAPRYHARDIALIRARIESAVIVLGSATPSIESMYNALNEKYELLRITQRAVKAELPECSVVDIKEHRKNHQVNGAFSNVLVDKIIDRVVKKEGVILFHNRRGFSSYLECPDCGHIPMCKNCSVTMTYHKRFNQLRCHYCGYIAVAPNICPECGHPEIKEIGRGTQRIEEELSDILKAKSIEAVIDRMDLDTTSRKGEHRKLLYSFASGDTDILVGTQMVAKGLDFDRVTLVGVINSDLQLFLPDFRASEKTFQLLTQVAGRAGRSGDKHGEVIIQTSHSDAFSIQTACMQDYNKYYESEIQYRKETNYPPFARFVLIEFYGKNETEVARQCQMFYSFLPQNDACIELLGPVEPMIAKIRNQYRRIIVLKNIKKYDPNANRLKQILSYAMNAFKEKYASSSVRIILDIDSYSGI